MAKTTKISPAAQAFTRNLALTSATCELNQADIHDDIKREVSFLNQALAVAAQAKKLLGELGFGFGAPEGYFCEMLKTEEHMSKIKKREDEKVTSAKASEEARKQRHMKKFGKKVQTETLMERAKQKKEDLAKIAQLRKKRKASDGNDEFEIDVDSDEGAQIQKKKVIKNGKKTTVEKKAGPKRDYKDSKFGFGGKKWDKKKNTRDSTDDFDFNPSKNKRQFSGVKPKGKPVTKRPGKQRRQNNRNKNASRRN